MSQYKTSYDIKYTNELDEFLQNEVLPGLDISVDEFWKLTSEIITEFSDRNKSLLEKRKDIQKSINVANEFCEIALDKGLLVIKTGRESVFTRIL